jgi:hypothetical protein
MNTFTKQLLVSTLAVACMGVAHAEKDPINNTAVADEWLAYSSSATQQALSPQVNVGDAVMAQSILGQSATTLGFAEKSPEARTFLTGALYAEALALTRAGRMAEATKRLDALVDLTAQLHIAPATNQYLYRVQHLLQRESYSPAALAEMLSLAQPFLDAHNAAQGRNMLLLFQTGAWLADYAMIAGSGDYQYLRQPMMLGRTLREMERLEAPKGVLDALREIRALTAGKGLGEREAREVQRLVRKMQELLG